MKISVRDAWLSALCYADIFDFPLTKEEVVYWAPRRILGRLRRADFSGLCQTQTIGETTYWALRGRTRLIARRRRREICFREKWQQATTAARLLRWIPSIVCVGVTGGVAWKNADQADDIDFLVIASKGTLWVTRFFSTLILDACGFRRRPGDTDVQDRICLNMFMSERTLSVPFHERDLFTAHEVLQMQLLWDRHNTFSRFIHANRWVKKYLPHAWGKKTQNSMRQLADKTLRQGRISLWPKSYHARRKTFFASRLLDLVLRFESCVLRWFERPAKIGQLWYMEKRRSTEVISDTVIRFHPVDARVWIKLKLASRLRKYNIPLDKIFYAS
ncbi:hypothetical protein A2973_05705 [Candidatus Gottesmanbacteria bacterium RIFCSPLOWO2_01_FULL_49_10]|uniref:Polymerase nucleotidyl transferase domain-containing protein n=1 Tax=Candidatus Gottesmanbacteria bacterium RIFCSPLOWO2_01_FULL_49_10 TaxID=1798396 RepID=A0A1F6B1G9_9BACT|nr:MAG: hypothetical protein UY10_C0013G0015 [Microgenomates group bacterium GW2011_GWA2_47_8]OGG30572.1 MAG: hypothetical protein A2973_05705 [Candidatus Gottesmanbacteria bacterium RIFCSPLOWO2_01_FULL_49_10]